LTSAAKALRSSSKEEGQQKYAGKKTKIITTVSFEHRWKLRGTQEAK